MTEHTFDADSDPALYAGSTAQTDSALSYDSGESNETVMDSLVEYTELITGTRLGRLAALSELDSGEGFRRHGYTSASAFLIHRCGMSAGEAGREVFLARSLSEMPYAVKSAYAGHISVGQLEVLAHARSRHPEPFPGDEAILVEAIAPLTLAQTRQAVDHWIHLHDEGAGEAVDEEPSRVYLSKSWQGRGRLDGDLDRETADLLDSALDELVSEIVDNTPHENLRPAPVLRGEALGEMARRFLDAPEAPTDHGNRPHITVVIDWATLTGQRDETGGVTELLDGTAIPPADARRLACDARVCRLLTGPAGEILDMGRAVRTVTPAQWRALRVRDRHCQFRGCYRPWSWCDAHHIDHWTEDGPTDLANLVLVCRYHHTLIHRHRWKITGSPGDWTITRPDGVVLDNGPP